MKSFEVLSPLRIGLYRYKDTKKNQALNRVDQYKWFSLNLNEYRNAHFTVLNDSKRVYGEIMYSLLVKAEAHYLKLDQIKITYQIIVCNKRKFDYMNHIAILDKYFQDVLVNMGIIPDDNYKVSCCFDILPVVFSKEFTENVCRIKVEEYGHIEKYIDEGKSMSEKFEDSCDFEYRMSEAKKLK